jgi:hypothetical protein
MKKIKKETKIEETGVKAPEALELTPGELPKVPGVSKSTLKRIQFQISQPKWQKAFEEDTNRPKVALKKCLDLLPRYDKNYGEYEKFIKRLPHKKRVQFLKEQEAKAAVVDNIKEKTFNDEKEKA